MPDGHSLLLFIGAGLLLNLTPGPDVFFIIANALRRGARAGVVAALGITAGCCVHIAAAAVGVSALVAASATAFTLLKWVGAAYLVYVGLSMLLARKPPSAPDLIARSAHRAGAAGRFGLQESLWSVFRRGFLTNVLNPKVALFFLAFVPQFIAPGTAQPSLAFLALGLLFNFNGMWVNIGWALAAAWAGRRVDAAARRRAGGLMPRGMHWLERAAGVLFVAFGIRLALTDAPSAP